MQGFTAGEAEKLTGVPYDRLDYWVRSGFIKPSIAGAKGKGSKRLYGFATWWLCGRLKSCGI